jgi:hypothetical protein
MPQEWLDAPGNDCCESFEICIFKFIEIFPVIITFTLLIILTIFYVFVSYLFITNFFVSAILNQHFREILKQL